MDFEKTATDLITYLGNFTDGKKYVQILEKYRKSLQDGSQVKISEDDLFVLSFLKRGLEKRYRVEKFRSYIRNKDGETFDDFLELVKHMETTCKE